MATNIATGIAPRSMRRVFEEKRAALQNAREGYLAQPTEQWMALPLDERNKRRHAYNDAVRDLALFVDASADHISVSNRPRKWRRKMRRKA